MIVRWLSAAILEAEKKLHCAQGSRKIEKLVRAVELFEAKRQAAAERVAQDQNRSRRSEKINAERDDPAGGGVDCSERRPTVFMTGDQPGKYRNLANYVRTLAVKVPTHRSKKRVWEAFRGVSGLEETKARRALEWGKLPIVRVKKLPSNVNGQFRPSTPNVVYLNKERVDVFERNHASAKMREVVEGVILHELVHWANDKEKGPHKHGRYGWIEFEMGDWFEMLGYGRDATQWAKGPTVTPLLSEIKIKSAGE